MRFITKKKNGDSILLNEIAHQSQIEENPYRCKFSNGLIIEANFIADITNGYKYTFEEFSDKHWVCCPFSVYGNNNVYPIVKLEWIHKNEFVIHTEFEGHFSIEFVAVGRWK